MQKWIRNIIMGFMFGLGLSFGTYAEAMSQAELERIVKEFTQNSKGEDGVVEFVYNNVAMAVVSNDEFDRMRIIAPIIPYQELTQQEIDAAMASNFHRALDARYALSQGILYSIYIHPLSSLDEVQIRSAIFQVSNLALSFGEDFSSGVLDFAGTEQRGQEL